MSGSSRHCSLLAAAAAATALLVLLLIPSATADCEPDEKAALLELKNAMGNPVRLRTWRIKTDCCEDWGGTQCEDGRVIRVDIADANDAVGTLSADIGDLSFLQSLSIKNLPNLTDSIPTEICRLRRLSHLEIQGTGLAGPIPDCIGQLRQINYLSLAQNKLTGSIPSSLGRALNIVVLYLDSNQLTGTVPASLSNLQPRAVNISRNRLYGDATALINAWQTAEVIDISRNNFFSSLTGVNFPPTLEYFSIQQNHIYGNIPTSCGRMTLLQTFDVSKNRLSGPVPSSMANLPLRVINLSGNQLSGDVSGLISRWTKAETVDISGNTFCFDLTTVRFPAGLKAFSMRSNGIYGNIPANADAVKGLQQFDVSKNKLCGSVPQGGVINKFPAAAFEGNTCMCDPPLVWCIFTTCPIYCPVFGTNSCTSAAAAATRAVATSF